MKAKRIIIFSVIILLLFGAAALGKYLKSVSDYQKAVREITFDDINISDIADGVYTGEYDVNFIYARVEVTVRDGAVTDIDIIEHKNERGGAADAVVDKIIAEQRTDVDAVSGATNSSAVIKKAVENALKNG